VAEDLKRAEAAMAAAKRKMLDDLRRDYQASERGIESSCRRFGLLETPALPGANSVKRWDARMNG